MESSETPQETSLRPYGPRTPFGWEIPENLVSEYQRYKELSSHDPRLKVLDEASLRQMFWAHRDPE